MSLSQNNEILAVGTGDATYTLSQQMKEAHFSSLSETLAVSGLENVHFKS
ncbi:MAG: hypothetical protein HC862_19430 [Scytonema sp. RU_4_4]|nr:hypothetical protein [Scytonema sp. RU_4_4]NJR74458.1 hypothetical protein [Scytonema sp. CRU_2_7]